MPKRRLANQRVLVTGASSGIGRALCYQLHRCGVRVLATARREDRLRQLEADCHRNSQQPGHVSHGMLQWLAGDISSPEHRLKLHEWILREWGALDILINNAGVGAIGPFEGATEDRLRRVMEIDFFAPVELTRVLLPVLKKGSRPAILNIGSVLSHRAVPNKSEYCAAKFAIRGWAESLRVELRTQGIDVLMLSPSTTRSEFFDSMVGTNSGVTSKSVGSMSPDQVASAAISSLVCSKREQILSLGGKALVWAGKLFPRFTDRMLERFGN